jgi:hypothetical protein
LSEKEAQAVIIIEGSAEFAAADAVTRRTVMTQHIQGDAADQGQVFRRVIVARPTGIFPKLDIQDPMLLIFNTPVTAHRGGEPF